MKPKSELLVLAVLGAVTLVVLAGLAGLAGFKNANPAKEEKKVRIVTTLYPLQEFAKEVGGDKVNSYLLLPPGAEAHTFEPTPGDIQRITESDIFIYIGAGMEPWAQDILGGISSRNLTIVDSSEHIKLRPDAKGGPDVHGSNDPHVWTDFENDMKIVDAIAGALIEKDPENREFYLANAGRYNQKLAGLDDRFRTGLKDCKNREYINGGHKAFEYLNARYNLTELAVYEIAPDSEPTPRKMKEITDIAREHNIKYVFVERLVSSKVGEALAEDINAKLLTLNAGHNLQKDQMQSGVTFISLMEENLQNLKIGLECV